MERERIREKELSTGAQGRKKISGKNMRVMTMVRRW